MDEVKKMKKRMAQIGVILMLLCGCGKEASVAVNQPMPVAIGTKQYVDVFTGEMVPLGLFEPVQGVYLGSYVEKNTLLEGRMSNYEKIIGQKQAFRVFQYDALGDIGQLELLQCIAAKQTPYIKILPNPTLDLTPIYELVTDLKNHYEMPLFIELLPVTQAVRSCESYRSYYQKAHDILKEELEEAVIVWAIDVERAEEAPLYYPGNTLVDWVGLNVYLPNYLNEEPYVLPVEEKLDFWYKYFQKDKPMMLSTLAISHFSRVDHTYTVQEAKNELDFYYKEMPERYPRIKGILYADVDMHQIKKSGLEDYRLTSDQTLIEAIGKLQAQPIYCHELITQDLQKATQPIKYTCEMLVQEGKYYVDKKTDKQWLTQSIPKEAEVIYDNEGKMYYAIEALEQYQTTQYYDKIH